MSPPQDEARQRMLQSQRLLGEGKPYLARLAANIAVALDPGTSTTRNSKLVQQHQQPPFVHFVHRSLTSRRRHNQCHNVVMEQ